MMIIIIIIIIITLYFSESHYKLVIFPVTKRFLGCTFLLFTILRQGIPLCVSLLIK